MSLADFAQLSLIMGVAIGITALLFTAMLLAGGAHHNSLFISKTLRDNLTKDYKEKKVFLGGLLGLIRIMLIIAGGSLALGVVLYSINGILSWL